jgi:hypothetical protein
VNVLAAETVLVAVFHKTLACVKHENTGPNIGVFLISDNDAGSSVIGTGRGQGHRKTSELNSIGLMPED